MKLPENVVIADDKLLQYLLLPREENDKSEFLAIAGYTLNTWEVLKKDLNDLAKAYEIADTVTSLYCTGPVCLPNGAASDGGGAQHQVALRHHPIW